MRAESRSRNASCDCMPPKSNRQGTARQGFMRGGGDEKNLPPRRVPLARGAQISAQGMSDGTEKRKQDLDPCLGTNHAQRRVAPVDVIQTQPQNLSGAHPIR